MFYRIQTNIVIILILSVIFIHAIFKFDKSELKNRLFLQLMGIDIIIMMLEIGSVILDNKDKVNLRFLHLIMNLLGFMSVPMFLFSGIMYFECYLQKNLRRGKILSNYIYVPAIILFILTLMNVKTGWIATVNVENEYIRGTLFWTIPTISLFYLGYALLLIWRYHKKLIVYKYVINSVCIVIIGISMTIQVACEIYLIIWSTIGGLLVCIYIFNIIDQLQHDALTTVENKQSYLGYVSRLVRRAQLNLTAINIDLDDFKTINDCYGHQEGDEALKNFAQILRANFPHKHRIFRMGGDEFLILSEQQNKGQMIKYMERFKESINVYNSSSNKPYQLKFSYGIDSYSADYKNIEQFLNKIDGMMYAQKKRKKRRI